MAIPNRKLVQDGNTMALLGEEDSVTAFPSQLSHGSVDVNPSSVQSQGLSHGPQLNMLNGNEVVEDGTGEYGNSKIWQTFQLKADIVSHPLYEQLLAAHVACLRMATPADQIPKIDAQLANSHHVATKYSAFRQHRLSLADEKDELDQFMAQYLLLFHTFKEQLQQVGMHGRDAMMACWEIERNLVALTGASLGEGTGATMSDEEEDNLAGVDEQEQDNEGLGPLVPTETERSLMERVRQELKAELKQGFKDKIFDVREEIIRKRRAGKLPSDTTSALKSWWQAHSKWPYPTEEEKAHFVKETGLQLKQINNWFINQRKRNWHVNSCCSTSSSSSSTTLKSKRKL